MNVRFTRAVISKGEKPYVRKRFRNLDISELLNRERLSKLKKITIGIVHHPGCPLNYNGLLGGRERERGGGRGRVPVT